MLYLIQRYSMVKATVRWILLHISTHTRVKLFLVDKFHRVGLYPDALAVFQRLCLAVGIPRQGVVKDLSQLSLHARRIYRELIATIEEQQKEIS